MYWLILKKELKYFFKNTGNLIFIFVLPSLMILLMSAALNDFVAADFDTFEDGVVLYYESNITEQSAAYLQQFRGLLKEGTNVELREVGNLEYGKTKVDRSEAFGLISINKNQFSYYRSPYNEPIGGQLVRGIFEVAMGRDLLPDEGTITSLVIEKPEINSNAYFTFSMLSFMMMFTALMIGHSVIDERRFRTIERIKLSRMGLNTMLMGKVTLGLCVGVLQIGTVYIVSTLFLGVDWGSLAGYMILVLMSVALFSSVFGAVMGMIAKTKTVADSIVLMSIMMSAYLGGSFAPVYLMENMRVVRYIIKISPLYWIGESLNSLYLGVLDENTFISLAVFLLLTVFLCLVYVKLGKKSNLAVEAS